MLSSLKSVGGNLGFSFVVLSFCSFLFLFVCKCAKSFSIPEELAAADKTGIDCLNTARALVNTANTLGSNCKLG